MKENFVSYDLSLELKELMFNEPCLAKYCRYNPKDKIELFPQNQNFFKGYFESCNNHEYKKEEKVAAPLYQQVIKWLREIHNIEISVRAIKWENTALKTGLVLDSYEYEMYPLKKHYYIYHKVPGFKTYEQALEQAILESLKLIKDEKN